MKKPETIKATVEKKGKPTKPAGCFLQIVGGGFLFGGIVTAATGGDMAVGGILIIIGIVIVVIGGQAVR